MKYRKGEEYGQALEYVKKHVSRRARLEQVAEEAAELAQAALKLIRAEVGDNPTPVDKKAAKKAFWEEVADVNNAVNVVGFLSPEHMIELEEIKVRRWAERVEASNGEGRQCYEIHIVKS